MSATAAPSARPAWAITAWIDDSFVYTEVPAISGPPLIQKYELCDAGLSKALAFMRDLHRKHQPAGGSYTITQQAKIKTKAEPSVDQRAKASAILKRMKIT